MTIESRRRAEKVDQEATKASSPGRTRRLGDSIRQKLKVSLSRSKSREASESNRRPGGVLSLASTPMPSPAPLQATTTILHASPLPTTMDDDGEVTVPQLLQQGTHMTKVSSKKRKRALFRLDPDLGQIFWDGKKRRIIPIENIKELRSGSDARYYREQFQLSQEYEDRWLTIVYTLDGAYKTLHLIAPTREVFLMWDTTLRKLYAIRQQLMSGLGNIEMRQAIWEKHLWKGADEEQDQKLSFDEVEKLCRRLNINSNSAELFRLFQRADTRQRNFLDFEDFRVFVKMLKSRPEIERLYRTLARDGDTFDLAVFERFMRDKQKSNLSSAELQAVFERYSEPGGGMTPDTLTSFLLSPENSAFADQHGRVWQDMTRPLCDYYVSSSHNTYLVGHQLVGDSTIEGYIRALLHSCRSVEVDIYDGDTPSEPQIFHGKSFTSKVSLRDVCVAISKYGFAASPYPIIISAEIHCSLAAQDAIADIMVEVFGDVLVRHAEGPERIERLPSPEQLKGRILLKAKNLYLVNKKTDGDEYALGELSASTSSASDSDTVFDQQRRSSRGRGSDASSSAVKGVCTIHGEILGTGTNEDTELRDDLLKAGTNVLQRVRSVGKSSTPKAPRAPMPAAGGSSVEPKDDLLKVGTNVLRRVRSISKSRPICTSPSAPAVSGAQVRGHLSVSSDILQTSSVSFSPTSTVSSSSDKQTSVTLTPTSTMSSSDSQPTPSSVTTNPLPPASPSSPSAKPKMSQRLLSLLVYTVGVKCRGINKKEAYAPEHMFSLAEGTANRMFRAGGMPDVVKHCRTHLVRVYPKGLRVSSSNYEPQSYWSAGVQLVAMNWQTFDLGYMINRAMFQRNGRAGYVLKPTALLGPNPGPTVPMPPTPGVSTPLPTKDLLLKHTRHTLVVTVISAQQLPGPKDASSTTVDPYVEVSLHVPDWPALPSPAPPVPARTVVQRTQTVRGNGFNPVWEERLGLPFEVVGEMRDLVFVRFVVRTRGGDGHGHGAGEAEPLAVYCASLGSLGMDERQGHDTKLFQYCSSDVRDILSRHMRHTGERDTRGPADFSDGAAGAKMGGAADVDEEDEEGEAEDVVPPPPAKASRGSARDKTDEEFRPSARVIAEPSTKQRPSMSHDRSRSTVSLPSYPPVPPSQLPVSSDRMHQHQRPYDDVPHTNKRPRLDSSHDSYGLGLSTTHLSRPGHLPLSSASSEESVSISMHHRNRNIGPGVGAADDSGYIYHPAHQQFRGPGSGLQRMSSDPSHHQSHSPQYPPPYSASSYSGTPPSPHGPPHSYASSYSDFPMPWANGGGGGGGGGSGGGGRSQSQHQHSAPSSATSMATFFPPAPGTGGGYPDPTAFPRGDDAKSSFASAFLEAEQHRRTAHHGSRSGHAQSAAAFGLDWPEHVRPQPSPAPAPAQAQQQQQSSQRRQSSQRGEEQQEARESASKADGSGAEESTVVVVGAGDGDGDGAGEEGENDSQGQGEQQNEVGWLELLGGGAPPAAETRVEAALVGGA
ncbi:hypothetical protein H0H81_012168 [Sphagnurus paluster]|uniref:Phosphoinositide phospholipase C n=1 Tax=Sphagnurus paluster TaxID=117069 RepID=A0A9P7FNI1_9AGAR|nr:hypothetical protein H0H81_012168 [Sphagnurus paluster]